MRHEGPTLDFKREMYKLFDNNPETKKRQRAELIKDILSLANGNASVAGEVSYIVIGADDTIQSSGIRELFDIQGAIPTRQTILQIVNDACDPPLDDIFCDLVKIDSKQLCVITIPPSPHVYETVRTLYTPNRTFNEYTVFTRHGADIEIASAKDRVAIARAKQHHFTEKRNAPPILFGAVISGVVVWMVVSALTESIPNIGRDKTPMVIAATLVATFLGGLFGNSYKELITLNSFWRRASLVWRIALILVVLGFTGALWLLWSTLFV